MNLNRQELLVGILFLGLGTAGLVMAGNYAFMVGNRIGPGAFPTFLAGLMIFLGLVQSGVALGQKGTEEKVTFTWRPLAVIIAAVLAFAALIESVGAAGSLLAAAVIVGFAQGRPRWRDVAIVYCAMLAFVYFVLMKLLGATLTLY
jgi:hypothetical protein